MVWNFEDNTLQPNEIKIYKYLKKSCNPRVAENLTKFLSLHDYMANAHFRSPGELRQRVLMGGKPFFTAGQSERLYERYATRGGDGLAIDGIAANIANLFYNALPMFATRFIDNWQPTLMILKGLVDDPDYGPLVDTALNMMSALISSSVQTIETVAAEIGGPPGAVIGYGLGSIIALLGVLTHVSKGELGQAFEKASLLLPAVGLSLNSLITHGSAFIEQTLSKEEQFLEMIDRHFNVEVSGLVKEIVNDWIHPPISPRPLIQKLEGLRGILPPEISELATTASAANGSIFSNVIAAAKNVTPLVKALPAISSVLPAVTSGIPTIAKLLPTTVPTLASVLPAPPVGNTLSGGKHSKSKWRTQRRLRR